MSREPADYVPPLSQIAFSVVDLRLTERWFREGFGLLPNPRWPQHSKFRRRAEERARQRDGAVPATRHYQVDASTTYSGPTPNAAICSTHAD